MNRCIYLLVICTTLLFLCCRKNNASPPAVSSGRIKINISYQSGNNTLIFDSLLFINEAGNKYSVTQMQYYLSGFCFYKNNQLKYSCTNTVYIDARIDSSSNFVFSDPAGMQAGDYDSVSFNIGVDSAENISNGLPATIENIAMNWPDAMGGGYHFLKLEGHWVNGTSLSGYAMHLGTNKHLIKAGVKCNIRIDHIADGELNMIMDINEWYRHPYIYNLSTDGSFSMGDTVLMQKLADNGTDVFRTN